jgi:hypothetical protein
MDDPTKRTLADWIADLEESEAEVAAGLTVPLAPILEQLRESIRRLEAKAQDETQRETATHG